MTKYINMFGGIQPVPFLRNKYDIYELFVESCIELLEDEQREGNELEKWTKITNYKKIFTDARLQSKRRIIDGEPGYGKSTLALQITQDWCRKESPMTKFDVLILLRLRELRNAPTIYSAIRKFLLPKDTTLTEDDIKGILNSSSTVILLDGYDEYPERGNKNTDIEHIISENMFQQHEVILMTRTSCLPTDFSRDTKRIRLTGFDDAARDRYIRNVVARGDYDRADEIHRFFRENPVSDDFSKIPLFFVMISQMVQRNQKFQNLNTVTEFFRHVVRCFHSHEEIRAGHHEKKGELDHTKLDRIAFEGLSGNSQELSWKKKDLKCKIGHNLYLEYVRIGFLIEEDYFDYDALEYKTETRFCHKLFAEWFAAQYLAKQIARPNVNFKQTNKTQHDFLKSLNPHDVHYMYRYACGLNPEAAVKIIEHLGKSRDYDEYTLLCISEWGGNLEKVSSTVFRLCLRNIKIKNTDSLLLRTSTVELIKFASSQKIPLCCVELLNCLDLASLLTTNLPLKSPDLSLPVMTTLKKLVILEDGLEITEGGTHGMLDYTSKCHALQELEFHWCIFPRYVQVAESLSALLLRGVKVYTDDGRRLPERGEPVPS
ncbi:NLR family CARD domain-containing protein 4 [Holothuria leucospilota]|uniref:NLR family CARD domain-containing protein 4 n=1 Tax=Holothuria leucospilota TaxID=206669 RepID=A0A9Q1C236_HOLLE|nr:NLR family CARD domain-containing protein 4 [Holothuria leucospilota]